MGTEEHSKKRKSIVGIVVSDKMQKTAVVKIQRLVRHPVYKKYIRIHTKLKAHDKDNACHIGDRVRIRESRPLSKTKRWVVVEILEQAEV